MANNAAITDGRNFTGHLPAILTVTASLPLSAASSACQSQQGPDAAVRVRAQDTVCAACGRGTHSSREGQAAGTVATQTTHLSQHSSARWTGQGTGQGSGRKPCPACYLGRMREERTAEKNKTEGQAEPCPSTARGTRAGCRRRRRHIRSRGRWRGRWKQQFGRCHTVRTCRASG